MKKMVKKTIFIFALFLFLVPFLPLAKADFSIQSQLETNTVCPSSTIIINEIISSTSDASFSVSVSGSAGSFTTAVPSGFFLNSGQKQSVFLYITPSSKINPGSYNLDVQVTSQGNTKTVSHAIMVENCHKTSIKIEPSSLKSCTCEEKSFKITITNEGRYLENYNLNAEGPLAGYLTLSSRSFSLNSNQSIETTAYLKSPCNVFGNYDLTFKAISESKYGQAEAISKIELVPCYDYTISSEKNFYSLCENEKISIPVSIKNTGTVENIYSIKTSGLTWLVADQKSLKIAPDTEKTFNLIVQPPLKTQGNFSSSITFLSDKGSISKELNLDLNVDSCYGAQVSIEKSEDEICNGLANSYKILIKNTGKFKNKYNIVLEAPTWVRLDKTQVELNASQETAFYLNASPPSDTKATAYSVIVKIQDTINKIETSSSLSLKTISQEECYKPVVSSETEKLTAPQDMPATFLFTIENKGLKTADYVIELSGTASSFSRINPSTITLEPNKAQTLYLYLFPSIDAQITDYTLTLTARLKDSAIASKKTIVVNVVKSSDIIKPANITNQSNQTKSNESKIDLNKKSFWQGFWQSITGFFVKIFSPPKKAPAGEQSNDTNSPPFLKKNISDIELESGGKFIINLSEYFEDKDNDKMYYIAVKPQNLTLVIKGDIMTITAPRVFEGTREMTFFATDSKKMVASNLVKIIVAKSKEEGYESEVNKTENETQENNNPAYNLTNTTNNTRLTSNLENQTNLTGNVNETRQNISSNISSQNQSNNTSNATSNTVEIKPKKNRTNESIINLTGKITEEQSAQPIASKSTISTFYEQYKSYIILAILAAIVVVLIMSGLGKKILQFFEEEEPEKKKK